MVFGTWFGSGLSAAVLLGMHLLLGHTSGGPGRSQLAAGDAKSSSIFAPVPGLCPS